MVDTNRNRNIARKKPITQREAIAIADRQIWQREFSPDYDQVIKKGSTTINSGLRTGGPAPIVTQ